MSNQDGHGDAATIQLSHEDIDLIIKELMDGYLAGRMDNITYYDLHSKLFQGYFQIARAQAARDVKTGWGRRK